MFERRKDASQTVLATCNLKLCFLKNQLGKHSERAALYAFQGPPIPFLPVLPFILMYRWVNKLKSIILSHFCC